ncbi:chloramphenicol O-acetyltransferase type A [Humidesulfovibrio mexicanus]|uniref:Chloramphenicol O-acetyltransferase type A n=2 Tax=Humidesulfovibrio mexicanus TaxID=147047 RepID=A0A239CP66_9BACT|nr:chloramphenicol O-acetyltransferase type A [Humidesulfovibrio mexicanus]
MAACERTTARRGIDMAAWERREAYAFFNAMGQPYCSVTCELDVTPALAFMRQVGIPSYVGMIYLTTKAANAVPELRVRIEDGQPCAYDAVHPSFTLLDEAERLRFCRARFRENIREFIAHAKERMAQAEAGDDGGLRNCGQDVLYLSCLPWMHFTSVSHPMPMNGPDAIPRITWGRFTPRAERVVMAVDLMVHHGLADGLHMGRFMQTLQGFCAEPEGAFTGA